MDEAERRRFVDTLECPDGVERDVEIMYTILPAHPRQGIMQPYAEVERVRFLSGGVLADAWHSAMEDDLHKRAEAHMASLPSTTGA